MFGYLKRKLVYNKRFRLVMEIMKKIICVFKIIEQFAAEIRDLLFYTWSSFNDKDFLEYNIRRSAHILEKCIKNPDKKSRSANESNQIVFMNLQKQLLKWKGKGYGESESIKWADKIKEEYCQYNQSKFECPLIDITVQRKKHKDFLSLVKERRSIRLWKDAEITRDEIFKLIDAARWAPSSCNRQTCRFIVVNERELISTISRTVKGGRPFFGNAPLLIIVLNDIRPYVLPEEKYVLYQDAASAIQNILLMAQNMGLGACWGAYTSDSGIILNEGIVRRTFRIPLFYKISGIVAAGRPAEKVCIIPRRDFNDIVSFNKF